jgi:hypothetical protein
VILGLIEEALVTRVQQAQKWTVGSAVGTIGNHGSSQNVQPVESAKVSAIDGEDPQQNLSTQQGRTRSHDRYILQLGPLRIKITTLIHKKVNGPQTQTFWRIGAVVTAAVALATNTWLAFRDRSARPVLPPNVSIRDETGHNTPTKPSAMKNDAMLASHPTKETTRLGTGFKRVRIGPNEVDYVADDVTIRHFTTRPAGQMTRRRERHVILGDDVTVRYFSYPPIARAQSPNASVPTSH